MSHSYFKYTFAEGDLSVLQEHCKKVLHAMLNPREYGQITYKTVEKSFMFFFTTTELEHVPPIDNKPLPHGVINVSRIIDWDMLIISDDLECSDTIQELKEIAYRSKVGSTVYCSYELYKLINKIFEE